MSISCLRSNPGKLHRLDRVWMQSYRTGLSVCKDTGLGCKRNWTKWNIIFFKKSWSHLSFLKNHGVTSICTLALQFWRLVWNSIGKMKLNPYPWQKRDSSLNRPRAWLACNPKGAPFSSLKLLSTHHEENLNSLSFSD